ncbi:MULTISPECIES: AMP-dependent synthetase/ligase [Mycolicibacterium]|uniref:AMP-dependent synthetase/ligase n=1 Tax=Mycolicibacterium TaxID=1866885 RepID=UPI00055AC31A|nr:MULTISPECIES: long-chain fatty acid--CoA ligase [Mycolicibacterium]MCV7129577.1 long-chain fatty acid--CoA ligase [Mycolicibacterium vanbaalenii PYR-1]PQP48556.1 long-chain fatty acid--CoA ligase [Mycolicibacterium austroafricanum]QZT58340.1 long-chain fatty acid--CoA ligase [Mycolicibacterium austroafricanum]QZY47672.1 long-chain fatty acid--CoA ligase [Mycolicibacterium austroafricanum]UJL31407.1 long-chain fatty acid--CoA ligase [Mycolicibacterium vanbaalenii]
MVSPTATDSTVHDQAPSVARLFRDRVAATPAAEAFRFPDDGSWRSVTWQQVGDRVRLIAAGLIALGVAPEDRVALASSTRYEWVLADFSVLCAGAATTTLYPTTNARDVAFIVANSGSRIVIAEDQTQVDKLLEHRSELPDLEKIVIIDGDGDGEFVITLDQLEELGAQLLATSPDIVEQRIEGIRPDHLASIIYTSGTTGRPKGVRLPHRAWTYTAAAIDSLGILRADDLNFLWLPLAHAFGKVMLALPLLVGFPTAIDGRVDRIVDNLAAVRPTFMAAAPRIFEKAHARIQAVVADEGGLKKRLFDWAVNVGIEVSRAREGGATPSRLLALQHAIADRLVLSTIRERFGGRLRFFVSAAAPLNRDIARWFDAIGIIVLEGYGLTETAAASFINRPGAYRFGTVGIPFPGTEVKIAADGEILLRSPGVMTAYHDLPEATARALDADGWFYTGDIGEIDDDGFLRITDRKKDLFKTSQGKYVAPSAVAAAFKAVCPYVSEIIVYGEERPYCVALVSLDGEAITDWAAKNGLENLSYAELARHDATRELIAGYVDELNEQLNRWEQVKRFALLDRELSIAAGDLTPSLKAKRNVIVKNFADTIAELYA